MLSRIDPFIVKAKSLFVSVRYPALKNNSRLF